ncbi:meiotically up-regulated gene 113 family protein [Synechococcus sp. WH 8103]|nr:meiotically up-regulated gene 113 family protein [Synechococcus sp. WH 8103]
MAKERAEFKEMMQAKREAKQVARAADEKAEFREFMREWIATKWDGETPDHLKKALRTGDPKDLGMLISEWHSYGGRKNNHASDATLTRYLDFPPADQSPVVDTPPAGFVYFVRNEDLFKIGITENMLRRLKQLAPDELLNVVRCSNFQEVERELHRRFKDVRLPQTEYFRLSDQQVQEVHQLMVKLAEFQS